MADLINLGCDCCISDGCNFGCNPCIDSVDLTICGNAATFAWPLGTDGCGRIFDTTLGPDICPGPRVFRREIHNGCVHDYNICLGSTATIDPIVTHEGSIGDCAWKLEIFGYADRSMELSITFLPSRRVLVAARYNESWVMSSRVTVTKGYCTDVRSGIIPSLDPGSQNLCTPCNSPDIRVSSAIRFVKDFTLDSCSDFFDLIALDLDPAFPRFIGHSYRQPITVLGTNCGCSGDNGVFTTAVDVTIPAQAFQACTGTTASLQFTEGP